jgi:hypothetical protein
LGPIADPSQRDAASPTSARLNYDLTNQVRPRRALERKLIDVGWSTISDVTNKNARWEQRGSSSMCDYSLEHLASRPAKVGDKLVTTSFRGYTTIGFCAVYEPNVAVCLKPGTELAFEREIELPARLWKPRKLGATLARFRHVNEGCHAMHHDALELPGGQMVLLTGLREDQFATVIQLPAVACETLVVWAAGMT